MYFWYRISRITLTGLERLYYSGNGQAAKLNLEQVAEDSASQKACRRLPLRQESNKQRTRWLFYCSLRGRISSTTALPQRECGCYTVCRKCAGSLWYMMVGFSCSGVYIVFTSPWCQPGRDLTRAILQISDVPQLLFWFERLCKSAANRSILNQCVLKKKNLHGKLTLKVRYRGSVLDSNAALSSQCGSLNLGTFLMI